MKPPYDTDTSRLFMKKTLNGWERIVVLFAVIGGVTSGYIAINSITFPKEPSLESGWMTQTESIIKTIHLLAYMLRRNEIDEYVAKEMKLRESICSSTKIDLIERQNNCGLGVTIPGVMNREKIEEDILYQETNKAAWEFGFYNEDGPGFLTDQAEAEAIAKAKTIRPDLSKDIEQFYSIRLRILDEKIASLNELKNQHFYALIKYYSLLLVWIIIPGCCAYLCLACVRWVKSGFSQRDRAQ